MAEVSDNQPIVNQPVENPKSAKGLGLLIVLIALAILGYGGYRYLAGSGVSQLPTLPPTQTSPTANPFQGAQPTNQAEVKITKDGFLPATITIVKGSQITFTNEDASPHKIASQAPTGFGLEDSLATGNTFSYTFEEKGTFNYTDPLNPNSAKYEGVVIVE